jgi:hypothetical protein
MPDHTTLTPPTRPQVPSATAAYLPIVFAVLAVLGLGLWFSGGGDDGEPTTGGLVGAAVICLAMLSLIGFASWLASSTRPLAKAGAAAFAVAGLLHLCENLLVLGPGRHGEADASGVWDVINFLSPTAFAVLGLGALLTAIGLPGTRWLRIWGAVTGVAGLMCGLSSIVTALEFLPGPFNVSLLGWLIVVGLRRSR